MTECPYNPGINAITCTKCVSHCGFTPKEHARRKALINEGKGLTRNEEGLRHLKIERSK